MGVHVTMSLLRCFWLSWRTYTTSSFVVDLLLRPKRLLLLLWLESKVFVRSMLKRCITSLKLRPISCERTKVQFFFFSLSCLLPYLVNSGKSAVREQWYSFFSFSLVYCPIFPLFVRCCMVFFFYVCLSPCTLFTCCTSMAYKRYKPL